MGLVPDQARDQITRKAAPQLLMEESCPDFGYFEMGRATGAIEEMEIVGKDAGLERFALKFDQRFHGVIDSSQQGTLIEHHDATVPETVDCSADTGIDFIGMIDMDHHDRYQPASGQNFD